MASGDENLKPVVAHYNSSYLPITEVWLYNQLIHLSEIKTLLLCRTKANLDLFPLENVYALNDLPRIRKILNLLYFKLTGYIPWFSLHTREADILHVHFGYNAVKMTGLKRHLKIPMICSFYGIDAFSYPGRKKKNRKRLIRMFRQADKILVLGPYMRETLQQMGCPESKLSIHHLGVNTSKIKYVQRNYERSRPVRFLMASSFLEKKGVDICLKALSNLKEEFDFTVDIIGDGPLRQRIMKIIEEGGLQERVTLHGYKPYNFFIQLTYHCDIFLQASKTSILNDKEGTPMSIVDAMATGMPVVATRHSDIPEIVQDGATGYMAEENSVPLFEEAVRKMLHHISEISEFSENSRQWIEEQFDVEKQSKLLTSMYMDMMKSTL